MTPTICADTVPLRVEEDGSIRVGKSRVLLDLVVHKHDSGATPEEIVRSYPTLTLPDVYAAIAYYLRHRDEIAGYLQQREVEAAKIRQIIEANQPAGPGKEELLRRWAERKKTAGLLEKMRTESTMLPPGTPSVVEMLREDRDR